MESKKHLIREGDLCINGKTSTGQDIEVCAEVKDLDVIIVNDEPYLWTMRQIDKFSVSPRQDIYFHMKVKEQYTIKVPSAEPVERTARVLGWEDPEAAVRREPTIALIKAAAEKAGVDENTDFILVYDKDIRRQMNRVYVEFKWTD